MSELEQLGAFFLSLEAEHLNCEPDPDYLDEDDEDGFDMEELNGYWCASRGV